ncbi:MAG: hypothetical protein JWP02_3519, partial [Acidimicrobiales bacterium]|nr:hypothetical protein [Acidimicrobiales bacterium]
MKRSFVRALLAAAMLMGAAVTGAVAATAPSVPAAVPAPENDPFYAAPNPLPGLPPGAVVRSRPISVAALGIPVPLEAWHLMYMSTDAHGAPAVDVATVIQPLTAPTTDPRPLVAYQTAEDSLAMTCAPSYRVRTGMEKEEPSL